MLKLWMNKALSPNPIRKEGRHRLEQRNIEERAVETIARRQPVAGDLRQIIGILRIANEIERIGDLAKNIGKRIVAMNGEDMPRRSMRGVKHMAALMLNQLRDVLDSFACCAQVYRTSFSRT